MVKTVPIVKQEQVVLCCDKCGKVLRPSGTVMCSHPPKYSYSCECGFKTTASRLYPFLRTTIDLENAAEISEEELAKGD